MTKERYLEVCEALNSEPIEEEIPVDYDDLAPEVQEALNIYYKLQDNWDTMGGNYLGKHLHNITNIFEIYGLDRGEWRGMLDIILTIDAARAKLIESKKPKQTNKPQ